MNRLIKGFKMRETNTTKEANGTFFRDFQQIVY